MQLKKLDLVLSHITVNPEKAGGEDEGEIGSALKFEGDVLVDNLVGLFADSDCFSSLVETLYGKGHELIAKDISEISMALRLEKVQMSISGPVLEDERFKLSGCRLNSVLLVPKHGRAIGLTVKLYVHPNETDWNSLVALAKKTVTVSIWGGTRIEDKKSAQAALPLAAPEGEAPKTAESADAPGGVH